MIDFFANSGANATGTIIGGLLLTIILFLFNEVIFPKKNIIGEWKVLITILESTHEPFKDLQIEYIFHFLQKNNDIVGLGEKIKDMRPNEKPFEFVRSKRVRQEIEGYMERKFLTKPHVYLLIKEMGRVRISTTSYNLVFNKKSNIMTGVFESTAGDTKGTVVLHKK